MEVQVETQKIPWYRTRLLWGVVVGVLVLWGIFMFLLIQSLNFNLAEKVAISFGAGYFGFLGTIFLKVTGSYYIVTSIYFILLLFLGIQTFRSSYVRIKYSLPLVILFLSGTLLTGYFLFIGLQGI